MGESLETAAHPRTTMPIDLTSLRVFVSICEAGSIAGAAEREALAASAISKRVADIEAEVGTPLLMRRPRGVTPTAAGEVLLRHARRILPNFDQLSAELREHASGQLGHVKMLANHASIAEFLPNELSSFMRTHRGIRVNLAERSSDDVARGVESGEAEIGICRDFVPLTALQTFNYHSDNFALIVHEHHPLAQRESVEFVETLEHDQVGVALNSPIYPLMQRLAAAHGREVRFTLLVSTFDAAFRFIEAGVAVGVFPAEAAERHRDFYHLKIVKLSDAWTRRRMVLCVRDALSLSPAAGLLFKYLRSQASDT
jgi:DNA-binding transcriptional LysR family regulator